ncbi:neural cell adhesion molecule 1 isoform X3 [Pocillopora verrucosa]|uniref:neural cell adhesion molecule 1 isoform X3 n=1 Tax=Pocillopora verrucosa TaxID=203993 RepID=UPI0033403169
MLQVREAVMVKILLLIGALCSMTVTSTDGTVTLPQKTFKVQQGRDFRVSCEVTGEDFLYWSTPSKPARPGVAAIPSVNIQNGQTIDRKSVKVTGNTYELTIKDVSVQDGGNYVCQGSIGSAVFILEVDFEIGGVQKKQTLKIGEKGTIVLDVPAFPSPTYEWVKDGQEVTFPDPSGRRSLDSYTGSIVITQVQKSDEGNYSCTVTLGTGDTAHIEVTVVEMPKINKAKGNPVSRRLTQGFNATFLCDVESGYPKPNIEWWFEWSGKVKQVEVIHYPRYTHPTPNAWTITNIQPEDAGKYRCIATNEAGEDVQLFEITSVDVPPTIDPMDDIIANEGNRVELTCSVTGTPKPTVEWYYLGSYYLGQTVSEDDQSNKITAKIVFETMKVQNSGKYTCIARNGARNLTSDTVIEEKKMIELLVRSMPKINSIESPSPVYSFVGHRIPVSVTCNFYGYPVPTVKMFSENGTEIAHGNQSVSIDITPLSEDDFGVFNCTAENAEGTADYMVELKQAVPPGPPQDVQAEKTCNSITLMWKQPLDNGGMPIIHYVITILSNDSTLQSKNVDWPAEMHKIDYEFTAETTYEVRIKARSEPGTGQEVKRSVRTNKFCVPGKPTITNTEMNVDVDFIVTWEGPKDDGGDPNLKYSLEWRKKPINANTEVSKEENIQETQFKITGLDYGSEYEVKLFAVNEAGDSEADTKDFNTTQEPASTTSSTQSTPSRPPSSKSPFSEVSEPKTTAPSSVKPTALTTPGAMDPKVGARTQEGLGSGAIAGIVVAVILIVLITIDLFCCFFNSCGIIFCCHQAFCGGGGSDKGVKSGKDDYKDGKATEMEKKPLPEDV